MALLDEELVEYWLNNQGFFCMRGVKSGLGEIDFLCVRPQSNQLEAWHVEVQVSFRPMGYVGGDSNAKKRTDNKTRAGVDQWFAKKYTNTKTVGRRDGILPNANWQYIFVCAELKHPIEVGLIEDCGVRVVRYSDVISELLSGASIVNSTAGNIVEILRYAKDNKL